MEVHPHPSAVTLHQFNLLVVPALRRAAGTVHHIETTPAITRLATEGANEITPGGQG